MKHSLFLYALVALLAFGPLAVLAQTPNDPLLAQWAYADVGAYEAWDTTTGSPNVVVAVIDNGFDTWHPDIVGNVWRNVDEVAENWIDDDANGYIDDTVGWNFAWEDLDRDGQISQDERLGSNDPRPNVLTLLDEEPMVVNHGTLVAGLIGAVGNNGEDGAGIAWQVKLMNIKVVGNSGSGELTRLPEAIRYAVDNGAHVINMSFVGSVDAGVKDAVKYAYDRGVVVVAAAGNDLASLNTMPRYPVCADAGEGEEWVLGVSAIAESHRLASFSNVGSDCVDITAPGVGISSTLRFAPDYGLPETYGGPWQGTSFAAPFVSGAAALLKSLHPEWRAPEIYHAILSTVHKTPPKDEKEYTNLFGAGLLQIDKAVAYAAATAAPASVLGGSHVLGALMGVEKATGAIATYDPKTKQFTLAAAAAIKNVDDLAAIMHDEQKRFVSVAWNRRTLATVTVWDSAWDKVAVWQVPARSPLSVVSGDVTGDAEKEIVLTSAAPGTSAFRVFSLDGKLVKEVSAARHTGATLGLMSHVSGGKLEILAVYKDGPGFSLHHFASDLTLKKTIPISFMKTLGRATGGDIDGDNQSEYVVTSGVGDDPTMAYLDANGETIRQFSPYGSRTGTVPVIADYDGDGQREVIVAPLTAGQPVRVWNSRVRMITEWWPFGENSKNTLVLLPIYQ